MSSVINLLVRLLGQPGSSRSEGREHDFNCPNCAELYNNGKPDNRYNLGVNLSKPAGGELIKVAHCWKCGFKGELGKLFKRFGSPEYYDLYQQVGGTNEYALRVVKKDTYKRKLQLPEEYTPFFGPKVDYKAPERLKAMAYMTSRGVSEATVRSFRLGYAEEGRYQQRIILPSYDKHGELNYYVGRTYVGHEEKYRNPSVDKQKIIFNEHLINWELPITLTEGPFEVLAYGHNNITMLGKQMYPLLLEKLLLNNARVIIALNLDAFEEKKGRGQLPDAVNARRQMANSTRGLYKQLLDAGLPYVRWWKLPENDLGKTLQMWGEKCIFSSLATDLHEIDFTVRQPSP